MMTAYHCISILFPSGRCIGRDGVLTVYLYCSPVVVVLIGMVVCADCLSILFPSGRCIDRDGGM